MIVAFVRDVDLLVCACHMHTSTEQEIKTLLGDVVSRMAKIEALGLETSGKLEDLRQRIGDFIESRQAFDPMVRVHYTTRENAPAGRSSAPEDFDGGREEASRHNSEKLRFPMRPSGKIVLRRLPLNRREQAPQAEVFEAAIAGRTRQRSPRLLLAAAMVLLSLLVIGGIMAGTKLSTRISRPETQEPLASAPPAPFTLADSRNVLENFLAASTVDEAANHVLQQDTRQIERMREFYSRPGKAGWQGDLVDAKPSMTGVSGGNTFHFWRVRNQHGTIRIAPVVRLEGRAFLYWESYVGYGGMDFGFFVKEQPETPVEMRVLIAKARNGFSISGDSLVLEVSHPDSDAFEMVRVTDEMTRLAIEKSLRGANRPVKATVVMSYEIDSSGIKSPAITNFIGSGWGEDRLATTNSGALPGLVVQGAGLGLPSKLQIDMD